MIEEPGVSNWNSASRPGAIGIVTVLGDEAASPTEIQAPAQLSHDLGNRAPPRLAIPIAES